MSTTEAVIVLSLSACMPLLRWMLNRIAFKLFCYSSFIAIALSATIGQPWTKDSRYFWIDWPNQEIPFSIKLLYACELAYYISSIAMLALWEVPRKDSGVMMFHHFTTVVLVAFGYYFKYTRSGSMIMLLHDTNDVIMEVAKTCNYCGRTNLANLIFGLFVLSWVALRLVWFPYFIISSTFFEAPQILGYKPPYWLLFNVGLLILYAIHVWWFHLIAKIVWITCTTGTAKDIREDD